MDTLCQDEDYAIQGKSTHGLFSLTMISDRELLHEDCAESFAPRFEARATSREITIQGRLTVKGDSALFRGLMMLIIRGPERCLDFRE